MRPDVVSRRTVAYSRLVIVVAPTFIGPGRGGERSSRRPNASRGLSRRNPRWLKFHRAHRCYRPNDASVTFGASVLFPDLAGLELACTARSRRGPDRSRTFSPLESTLHIAEPSTRPTLCMMLGVMRRLLDISASLDPRAQQRVCELSEIERCGRRLGGCACEVARAPSTLWRPCRDVGATNGQSEGRHGRGHFEGGSRRKTTRVQHGRRHGIARSGHLVASRWWLHDGHG